MSDRSRRGAGPGQAGSPSSGESSRTAPPSGANATLDERLQAVERALTDTDRDLTAIADAAERTDRVEAVEDRVAEVEDRIAELESAVQAVRGYVGAVRAVNRDVERRADAALAAATGDPSVHGNAGSDAEPIPTRGPPDGTDHLQGTDDSPPERDGGSSPPRETGEGTDPSSVTDASVDGVADPSEDPPAAGRDGERAPTGRNEDPTPTGQDEDPLAAGREGERQSPDAEGDHQWPWETGDDDREEGSGRGAASGESDANEEDEGPDGRDEEDEGPDGLDRSRGRADPATNGDGSGADDADAPGIAGEHRPGAGSDEPGSPDHEFEFGRDLADTPDAGKSADGPPGAGDATGTPPADGRRGAKRDESTATSDGPPARDPGRGDPVGGEFEWPPDGDLDVDRAEPWSPPDVPAGEPSETERSLLDRIREAL